MSLPSESAAQSACTPANTAGFSPASFVISAKSNLSGNGAIAVKAFDAMAS